MVDRMTTLVSRLHITKGTTIHEGHEFLKTFRVLSSYLRDFVMLNRSDQLFRLT